MRIKIRSSYSLLAIIPTLIFFTGCGTSSPSQVVKNFYTYVNQGKYSEAESCFSNDLDRSTKLFGSKSFIDFQTKKETIKDVKVLGEQIKGEGATVQIDITYQDGSEKKDNIEMIKENSEWKIALK